MKNFFLRLKLFARALATTRPFFWFRVVWRARSQGVPKPAAEAIGNALTQAIAALDRLPDPEPLPFSRVRQLSRSFCADHCGLGFRLPAASPAHGFFWKRDCDGFAWRLYRERA